MGEAMTATDALKAGDPVVYFGRTLVVTGHSESPEGLPLVEAEDRAARELRAVAREARAALRDVRDRVWTAAEGLTEPGARTLAGRVEATVEELRAQLEQAARDGVAVVRIRADLLTFTDGAWVRQ